jgi:hypothetical protein
MIKLIATINIIFSIGLMNEPIENEKIFYYPIDSLFYKTHKNTSPQVVNAEGFLSKDFDEKGKELSREQLKLLNELIDNPKFHDDTDCGTIWIDGAFVFFDKDNKVKDYIKLSLDCYDLLPNHGGSNIKINLNEEGKKKLFELIRKE